MYMRILSLSLDPQILNKESVVAARTLRYGETAGTFTVIVPSVERAILALSPAVSVYGTGGGNKLTRLYRMFTIARSLLKKDAYDVISSQDTYFLGLLALFLGRIFHTGVEVQVLGIEKLSFFRKMLSQFVLRRAGSIRVLSLGLKKRLLKEFKLSEARMVLVPIYVDVSSLGFDAERQSPALQAKMELQRKAFHDAYGDRFNIVSVNRLVPIKNIPMQIEAIARLNHEFPQIMLHILGDGPLHAELKEEIEKRGLSTHVLLHGYKSGAALSAYLTEGDCYVLTSDFEGYGMAVIEAATAGLPIVMTDVGCAGEVIKDGESGLVVPVEDADAFTQALRSVIADRALRERLRSGAQKCIAELPSFDTVLERYQASWQQALAHRS